VPVRLYPANTAAPITLTADTAPGTWESVSSTAVVRALSLTKEGGSGSVSGTFSPAAVNQRMRLGRFVSPPLTRQVNFAGDSGDVTIAFARQLVTPSGTAVIAFWRFWGVSGDGDTFLGTPFGSSQPGVNWTTTTGVTAGSAPVSVHTAPFTAQAGDRIVLDIGFRITDTTTSSGRLYYGGTESTDLAEGDTGTTAETRSPWIEFSGLTAADFGEDIPPAEGELDGTLPAPSANIAGAVRANVILGGTLPAATAALTGMVRAAGTLTGLLPELTAALNGTVTTAGVLDASLPLPTGAIDGTTNTGRVSGTLPEPFANLSGGVLDTAVMDAVLPAVTASVDGDVTTTGGLDAALPSPAAELTATVFSPGGGFLSASLPMLSAGFDATVAVVAVIHGTLPEPTAALDAAARLAAVLDASLPVPTAALEATTTQPESRLDALLPVPTAAFVAAASTTGVLDATLPLPTCEIAGFPPPTYTPPLHAGEPTWGGTQLHAGSPDIAVGYVAGNPS
jgi:hypothetical protein